MKVYFLLSVSKPESLNGFEEKTLKPVSGGFFEYSSEMLTGGCLEGGCLEGGCCVYTVPQVTVYNLHIVSCRFHG